MEAVEIGDSTKSTKMTSICGKYFRYKLITESRLVVLVPGVV